jgi:hypothetical protein
MRYLLVVSWMLLCPLTSAVAQVSVEIGAPSVSIGINLPVYPRLVLVPGHPVYYAPRLDSNYFSYDGMYWVYEGDNWYASSWYNGPWSLVAPEVVPVYVLRVPVRYYRQPPPHFRRWRRDAPPRWGEHWGHEWERRHRGWNRWDRRTAPRPAPLPVYQKRYSGDRYPFGEQQQDLHRQHYRHRPRDTTVRQAYQAHGLHRGPPPSQPRDRKEPPARDGRPRDAQRTNAPPRAEPGGTKPFGQPPPAREQDRRRPGQGGQPERKANPFQPQGEERGPERNR